MYCAAISARSAMYRINNNGPTAYSVDMFCTVETFGCVYSIYTADILAT